MCACGCIYVYVCTYMYMYIYKSIYLCIYIKARRNRSGWSSFGGTINLLSIK